jgi:hypothetical protein
MQVHHLSSHQNLHLDRSLEISLLCLKNLSNSAPPILTGAPNQAGGAGKKKVWSYASMA